MSQYQPTRIGKPADPQFAAVDNHYERLSGSLMYALFESASELSPTIIPLDSELQQFCYHLWREGYKIVPLSESPAGIGSNDQPVPALTDQPPGIYYTAQTPTGPQTRYYPTETSTANDDPATSNDEQQLEMTIVYRRPGTGWQTWLPSDNKAEQIIAVMYSDAQPAASQPK